MQPAPYFHEASGCVRFWVSVDDGSFVGASIRREILQYRFQAGASGADALACYAAQREAIDAAVRRRIASGSIEPVMLRDADVSAPQR